MYLFNETIKINHGVHNDWLAWMKVKHIPEIMDTGFFREYRISRLLGTDESDGFTYTIQYLCPDFGAYQDYQSQRAAYFERQLHERYSEQYVVFRSVMKVVEAGGSFN